MLPERVRPSTELLRAMLERDLIEWADDESLRLVWADLLQIEGDPIGELIVADYAAVLAEAEQAQQAREQATRLRGRLHAKLWTREWGIEPNQLVWELGFVREADLSRHTKGGSAPIHGLDKFLREPALRFVEVLLLPESTRSLGGMLARGFHSTLRTIHCGQPSAVRTRPRGPHDLGPGSAPAKIEATIANRFPRLRWVTHDGELVTIVCCEGNSQGRAHYIRKLATRPLTSPNRTAIARALWDPSTIVQDAAHATIVELGPAAEFILFELELILRPPLKPRDPRPIKALQDLAAIGRAGARIFDMLLREDRLIEFCQAELHMIALLDCLRSFASLPAASSAIDCIANSPMIRLSDAGRKAVNAARRAQKKKAQAT